MLFAVSTLVLLAVPAAAMPWRWGARAGVNGANFGGQFGELANSSLLYGLNAGVVAEAGLSHALWLHGEVAYANKGATVKNQGTDPFGNPHDYKTEFRYDYIELPLLLRARYASGHSTTLFGELGPSFGFTIAGRVTSEFPGDVGDDDVKGDMKPVDAGFALGAGIEFAAGPGHLGIEARYTRGFSDLYDLEGNAEAINQTWTLALAWTR
jgi:hypothetical protein